MANLPSGGGGSSSGGGDRDGLSVIAFASDRFNSIGETARAGIMGAIIAVFTLFIDFWIAVAETVLVPLGEMATQLGNVVRAFIGGGAGIIGQGAESTIASLAPGSIWSFGPLGFAAGIIAAGLGWVVMSYFLGIGFTGNTIPFTSIDIPFIGVDEEDEEFDE